MGGLDGISPVNFDGARGWCVDETQAGVVALAAGEGGGTRGGACGGVDDCDLRQRDM